MPFFQLERKIHYNGGKKSSQGFVPTLQRVNKYFQMSMWQCFEKLTIQNWIALYDSYFYAGFFSLKWFDIQLLGLPRLSSATFRVWSNYLRF